MSATTYNSPSPPAYLFVYGSLKEGGSRRSMLDGGKIKSTTRASLPGELVNLGEYEGLRLDAYTKQRVSGELIEFEALDNIIAALDEEEGPEFNRQIVNVTLDDGGMQMAWVYVLAGDAGSSGPEPTGDWKAKSAGYS